MSLSGSTFSQSFQEFYPAYSQDDQIISHFAYSLKYSEDHEQAEWVIYFLTKEKANGSFERTDDFRPDSNVKTGSATCQMKFALSWKLIMSRLIF